MPVALSIGLFACPEGVMKIVVGLGNPGKQYEETRHNVGWMVLDRLAERAGWTGHARSRDAAATVHGRFNGLELMLVKPTTYMNLSGVAVRKVLARQRAPLDDLLVVVDDFDLPLGRIRMRAEGSAGTHNGLRSIIGELGSQKFARLRVGLGQPNRGAKDHVLSRFAPEERATLDKALDAAADAVEDWARFGSERAANKWNGWSADIDVEAQVEVADGSSSPGTRPSPEPNEPTIVRRSTGWRRLLPRSMREGA